MILDPDRKLFYTSNDYRRILSKKDFRKEEGWKTAPGSPGIQSFVYNKRNMEAMTSEGERNSVNQTDLSFALDRFDFNPGEKLVFNRNYDKELLGSKVRLIRKHQPSGQRRIQLPYPALSVSFVSRNSDSELKGTLAFDKNHKIHVNRFGFDYDIAQSNKSFSRVTDLDVTIDSPEEIEAAYQMRYAKKAFPQLHEGANAFAFHCSNGEDNEYIVKIEIEFETRIYDRDIQ
jgi:hypothetical protein